MLTILPVSVCQADDHYSPHDFIIEYVVENNILTAGKATFRLKKLPSSTHELTFQSEPSGLFRLTRKGRILEKSEVNTVDGLVRTLHYTHTNHSEPERSFQIAFDPTGITSQITTANKNQTFEHPTSTTDRLSMILSLMFRLRDAPATDSFSFPLLEKDGVRNVTFQVREPEILETAAGTFSTTVLKKIRENSNRHELIWFTALTDSDLPYPVQFEQYKQGSLVVRLKFGGFQSDLATVK